MAINADDLLQSLSLGNEAHNTLLSVEPETSVGGGVNPPPSSPTGNEPGLGGPESVSGNGGTSVKAHHWLWIILAIVGVLVGLWYFVWSPSAAAS